MWLNCIHFPTFKCLASFLRSYNASSSSFYCELIPLWFNSNLMFITEWCIVALFWVIHLWEDNFGEIWSWICALYDFWNCVKTKIGEFVAFGYHTTTLWACYVLNFATLWIMSKNELLLLKLLSHVHESFLFRKCSEILFCICFCICICFVFVF